MHGASHGKHLAGHHAEMVMADLSDEASKALAECCDSTGGMGSTSCLEALARAIWITEHSAAATRFTLPLHPDAHFACLTRAVPTGPPKV